MSREVTTRASTYLHPFLKDPRFLVRCAKALARGYKARRDAGDVPVPAEAVAFTGVSGSLLGPLVGAFLDLPLIVVRKAVKPLRERSHSEHEIEGALASRYLIVDDLTSSGATLRRVRAKANEWLRHHGPDPAADCVGAIVLNTAYQWSAPQTDPRWVALSHWEFSTDPKRA